MSLQFDKQTGTGASQFFNSQKVHPGVYPANPGSMNSAQGAPSGGEVRHQTIVDRAGSLGKPSLAGDASLRR